MSLLLPKVITKNGKLIRLSSEDLTLVDELADIETKINLRKATGLDWDRIDMRKYEKAFAKLMKYAKWEKLLEPVYTLAFVSYLKHPTRTSHASLRNMQ